MASFLRSLLPDEWVLWLSNPAEDQEKDAQILLHLRDSDFSLSLLQDVTRYDVVQFLKQVHDGGEQYLADNEKLKAKLSELFYLQVPADDWDEEVAMEYRELLQPFYKQSVIFKGESNLDILHEKGENGMWVTRICKSWPNSPDELHEIACINTDPTFSYPPLGLESLTLDEDEIMSDDE